VEEEEKIKQRWGVRDRLARDHVKENNTTLAEERRMTVEMRSHPLKHVYRIRQQTRANWEREVPAGGKLSFQGDWSCFQNEKKRAAKWTCFVNF
jgi:hypothetical protein